MELLFKREQTSARFLKVAFKLWGKVELPDDEDTLVKRYNIADYVMFDAEQKNHLRNSLLFGFFGCFMTYMLLGAFVRENARSPNLQASVLRRPNGI